MDVVDVVGASPTHTDPLWRVAVALSDAERALLRCWPVRRLAFVAHAGAAAIRYAGGFRSNDTVEG